MTKLTKTNKTVHKEIVKSRLRQKNTFWNQILDKNFSTIEGDEFENSAKPGSTAQMFRAAAVVGDATNETTKGTVRRDFRCRFAWPCLAVPPGLVIHINTKLSIGAPCATGKKCYLCQCNDCWLPWLRLYSARLAHLPSARLKALCSALLKYACCIARPPLGSQFGRPVLLSPWPSTWIW